MIGVVPVGGYRVKDRQSVMALKWLKWIEHSTGVKLQHAGNGGEVRIGNYKVDGYDPETNRVYEYYGCASWMP